MYESCEYYEPKEPSSLEPGLHKDTPEWVKEIFEAAIQFDRFSNVHNSVILNKIDFNDDNPWSPWPACKEEFFSALEVLFSKEQKENKEGVELSLYKPSNFHKSLTVYNNQSQVYSFAEKFYLKILLLERLDGKLEKRRIKNAKVDTASKEKFEKIVLGALPKGKVAAGKLLTSECNKYHVFIECFQNHLLKDQVLYDKFIEQVKSFQESNNLASQDPVRLNKKVNSLIAEKLELDAKKEASKKAKKLKLRSVQPHSQNKIASAGLPSITNFFFSILKYTIFSPWAAGKWFIQKLDTSDRLLALVMALILKLFVDPGQLIKDSQTWMSKNGYKNWGRAIDIGVIALHIALWTLLGILAPSLLGQMGFTLAAEFLAPFALLESFTWGISAVQVFSVLCAWVYMGLYHLMPSGNNVPIVNNVVNTAPMAVLNPSSSGVLDSSENKPEFNPRPENNQTLGLAAPAIEESKNKQQEPSTPPDDRSTEQSFSVTDASASTFLGQNNPAKKVETGLSIFEQEGNSHQSVVPL